LLLSLEAAQCAQFGAGQRVDRGYPALQPLDVQPAVGQIDLLPSQRAQFGCPQPVSECQQDHGGVAVSVPVVYGYLHQALDLPLGEVLAAPIIGIWQPTWGTVLFSIVGALARDAAIIQLFPLCLILQFLYSYLGNSFNEAARINRALRFILLVGMRETIRTLRLC